MNNLPEKIYPNELQTELKLFVNKYHKHFSRVLSKFNKNLYIKVINETFNLDCTLVEKIYCILNNLYEIPLCPNCGKPNHINKFCRGFTKTCSHKCARKYEFVTPNAQNKRKETLFKKFGTTNSFIIEKANINREKAMMKKYGVHKLFDSKEIQNNIHKTFIKKYGGISPSCSPIIRTKLRIAAYKYRQHNNCTFSIIGKNEKELLDLQEKKDNCKIDRKFTILGYYPDGYCHETNTIYEVYEKFHYKSQHTIDRDLIRQKEIQDHLKCKFIIINDETH